MDLKHYVKTFQILNIEEDESNITAERFMSQNEINKESFIVSDVDEELLILVEFTENIDLHSITFYGFTNDTNDELDISPPKNIDIFKIANLNKDFNDIKTLRPTHSIKCSTKKLSKGQTTNLTKKSKIAVQFKKTRYMAIYIKSNQKETEQTYLNGIKLNGTYSSTILINKIENKNTKYDIIDKKNKQKYNDIAHQVNDSEIKSKSIKSEYYLESCFSKEMVGKYNSKTHETTFATRNRQCELSENCQSIQRLGLLLNNYQGFCQHAQEQKQDDNKDETAMNIYPDDYDNVKLIDDYHHLLWKHKDEFENVSNILSKQVNNNNSCDIKSCILMKRNHRDRDLNKNNHSLLKEMYFNCLDIKDIAKQQIIDKIHCYYFHSFDTGYKLQKSEQERMRNLLSSMETDEKSSDSVTHDVVATEIFRHTQEARKNYETVAGLERLRTNNTKFISNFDNDLEKMSCYSYGFRFFYWEYYKHNETLLDQTRIMDKWLDSKPANIGSRLCDFYIFPKYDSLKDELINNQICSINSKVWDILYEKAAMHSSTAYVKQRECYSEKKKLYFGIYKGDIIGLNHLIAMMVYCNQDTLQNKYSATYRFEDKTDTLDALKERHSNYHHMGKLLRECVDCFGWASSIGQIASINFFHGINQQFYFKSCEPTIHGPLSSTTDYSVATNFCLNKGMIVEFRCFEHSWLYSDLNTFDNTRSPVFECKWLSDFPNEEEMFFIGGSGVTTFETIIQAPLGINYVRYIKALAQLSEVLNGRRTARVMTGPVGVKQQMFFRLLSHELHKIYPNDDQFHEFETMPKYIQVLLHYHVNEITTLDLLNQPIGFEKKLFRSMFFYDYGWIKLDVLTNLFGALRRIIFSEEQTNPKFICNDSIYLSTLDFLQRNSNTTLKEICIVIMNTDTVVHVIKQIIQIYMSRFNELSWVITLQRIDKEQFCYLVMSPIDHKILQMPHYQYFGHGVSFTQIT